MSFSSKLKTELCKAKIEGVAAKNALIAGIIFSIGKADGDVITIGTESSDVVKLVLKLLKNGLGTDIELNGDESSPFSKKMIYGISFRVTPKLQSDVLDRISESTIGHSFDESLDYFIRGVFLGVGSVTNPQKGYHMELSMKNEWRAMCINRFLTVHYDLVSKVLPRKNSYICYLKGAENISNFLTIIGAVSSFFEFEDARVLKQVRNNINRKINCDLANINKITDAALIQTKAIAILKDAGKLKKLGKKYEEIAALRMEYPELSIAGIAELTDPPITKSGCNHRFNKIIEEAKKIKGIED